MAAQRTAPVGECRSTGHRGQGLLRCHPCLLTWSPWPRLAAVSSLGRPAGHDRSTRGPFPRSRWPEGFTLCGTNGTSALEPLPVEVTEPATEHAPRLFALCWIDAGDDDGGVLGWWLDFGEGKAVVCGNSGIRLLGRFSDASRTPSRPIGRSAGRGTWWSSGWTVPGPLVRTSPPLPARRRSRGLTDGMRADRSPGPGAPTGFSGLLRGGHESVFSPAPRPGARMSTLGTADVARALASGGFMGRTDGDVAPIRRRRPFCNWRWRLEEAGRCRPTLCRRNRCHSGMRSSGSRRPRGR